LPENQAFGKSEDKAGSRYATDAPVSDPAQRVESHARAGSETGAPTFAFHGRPFASYLVDVAADFDIKHVAHLARLALTPEEERKFESQLGDVLEYIQKLAQLDVSEIEPTAHAVPMTNVMRPDEIRPSLSNEEALRNAPARANGLFIVPKIVE
jgi:aspartyl-tRNA(Asn)/glutamyl-tRNA(Gln) amidotransferase subunit C